MRKIMAYLMVVVLVVMAFSALSTSVSAEYVGDVTILEDGSVDPADAPISVSGMIYTMTDDISGRMRIKMSGITLDGAGYTISGPGGGPGILALDLTDLTIKGVTLMNFLNGIVLVRCTSSTVKENDVSGCGDSGIYFIRSNGNTIKDNKVHDNVWDGIWIWMSSNNIVKDNICYNNGEGGILVHWYSDNNLVRDNNLHHNGDPSWGAGIFVSRYCNNNIITNNDASNKNSVGIVINIESNNNLVTENRIIDNLAGGIYVRFDSNNNIITKNTINKCYKYGQSGVRLLFSSGNTVSQSSVSNCYAGLLVVENDLANGNVIFENTFRKNFRGLFFVRGGNNVIHHNNIIQNEKQVEDNSAGNQYDDGSAGNYWSDYNGKDSDGDGIGDTPYMIPGSAGEQDDLPLIIPWQWV
jgi:parallel beta-helix repeat protein